MEEERVKSNAREFKLQLEKQVEVDEEAEAEPQFATQAIRNAAKRKNPAAKRGRR